MSESYEQYRSFQQPSDIEKMYVNRDQPMPKLNAETLAGIKKFLQQNNFDMIAGSVCVDPEATVADAVELGSSRLLQKLKNNSFLGPYIDRTGNYYSSGIGYWTANSERAADVE